MITTLNVVTHSIASSQATSNATILDMAKILHVVGSCSNADIAEVTALARLDDVAAPITEVAASARRTLDDATVAVADADWMISSMGKKAAWRGTDDVHGDGRCCWIDDNET